MGRQTPRRLPKVRYGFAARTHVGVLETGQVRTGDEVGGPTQCSERTTASNGHALHSVAIAAIGQAVQAA
jgi:hypothetical protein